MGRKKAEDVTEVTDGEETKPTKVVNLMDALRQSLGKRAKTSTKGRRAKAKRTRKAA